MERKVNINITKHDKSWINYAGEEITREQALGRNVIPQVATQTNQGEHTDENKQPDENKGEVNAEVSK